MKKCKIVIPQSNRSDKPLTDPIVQRLRFDPLFIMEVLKVVPNSFRGAYAVTKNYCTIESPDILLAAGDRLEMAGCVAGAFQNHIKPYIIHYEAGVTNEKVCTLDDKNRHAISIQSDMQLCEDEGCFNLLKDVFEKLKLKFNGYIVGITRHDDLILSFEGIPEEPFDLILYNPPTMYHEDILSLLPIDENKRTIWVQPNDDFTPKDYFQIVKERYPHVEYLKNQPRATFLGLLSRCDRYMSNSSNIKYEAPLFKKLEDIIPIGDRNLLRSTEFKRDQGASMRIIKILREWWMDKNGGR